MIDDPSAKRVQADLNATVFQTGLQSKRWRLLSYAFPTLDFAISATEPNGDRSEYAFRAELTNFPGQAPKVSIWDYERSMPLAVNLRPKGGPRIEKTFQQWGSDTVYRPWDRETGPHGENARNFPHLAWRTDRRLSFIFEDLHGILNSNARAHRIRAVA